MNIFNKNQSQKDFICVVVFTLVLFLLFSSIDFFEILIEFSEAHEEYELDELILIALLSPLGLSWYGLRRYNEIKKMNSRLQEEVEKELKKD